MKKREIREHGRKALLVVTVTLAVVMVWQVLAGPGRQVRAAAAGTANGPAASGPGREAGEEDPKLSFSTSIEVHATAPSGVRPGAVRADAPTKFEGYLTREGDQ